jgi:hypothetical protein
MQDNIETHTRDSAGVSLSGAQMQAILDTVTAVGFFGLNSLYDGNVSDGSGISLKIVTTSNQNQVAANNYCVVEINRIVNTINPMIFSTGIQLNYGKLYICP